MARSYDGAGNTSAREQVEHGKQLEKARNQKIEFGVIIGAAAIAGLSILINTGMQQRRLLRLHKDRHIYCGKKGQERKGFHYRFRPKR